MLKRIRYASRFAAPLACDDIKRIVDVAAAGNAEHDITGILIATGRMFFQIIEGPADAIDALLERIRADRRHADIVVLEVEAGANLTRICPDWSMRRVDLSAAKTREFASLRASLGAILALTAETKNLIAGVEETVWALILEAELQE